MIRPAEPTDAPAILRFVKELAEYERAADEVVATEADLAASLFGTGPVAYAHMATDEGGVAVGFALWCLKYSTWLGKPGIYIEDLYVTPDARGAGYGRQLLQELARISVERGYSRMEWSVLDWNEPAIGFYRRLGAQPMDEWTTFRMSNTALDDLAAGQSPKT